MTMPTARTADFIGLSDDQRRKGETICLSAGTKSDNSYYCDNYYVVNGSQLERWIFGAIFIQFAMQRAPVNA